MSPSLEEEISSAMYLEAVINPEREISLALRTSLSAIEMELCMKHSDPEYLRHTYKLAQELESFSRENPSPLNSLMYANLLYPGFDDMKGKTTNDIYLQVNLLAKDLKCFGELNADRQKELFETCLNLSRLARHNGNPFPFDSYIIRLAAA